MTATLRSYKFILPAGEKREYPIRGDSLRVVSSNVPVYFSSKDGSTDFYLKEGEQARFNGRFEEIDIYHNDASEQTIVLAVGEGAEIGSALLSGSVALTGVNGGFTQSRASVSNVNQVLIAANENRKYLLIQNNDAAAVLRVKLDGSAATATAGFKIAAGGSLELNTFAPTGAINCMMETATAAVNNIEFVEG